MFNLIEKAKALDSSSLKIDPVPSVTYDIKTLGLNIANTIVWVAGVLAVIYLIYGGILYITSAGEEDKAKKGKTAVVNAIIGIAIVIGALIIVKFIKDAVTKGNI